MKEGLILYPFSAIVGQEKLKRALLINAVDPRIGGLLVRGERGTGKSTAARALAELLPQMEAVADCPFSCNPHNEDEMCSSCLARWKSGEPLPVAVTRTRFVTLPLNASEDRVVGTLDLERAVREGVKDFEPGILADANRSLLYVDEVNLLDDHIVDILLDAAAMGVNIIEREGVSFSHPSSFIMVGTMNPEEGDLRPQLEDRFGLCVEVGAENDYAARMEVMRRRQRFLDDPQAFRAEYLPRQEELSATIIKARERLPGVKIPDGVLELVSRIAVELGASGHRADISTCQAARALAAMDGSAMVEERHVREAAEMAFLHRLRKTPLDDEVKVMDRLERIMERKGKLVGLPLVEASAEVIPEGGSLTDSHAQNGRLADPHSCGTNGETPLDECQAPVLSGLAARVTRKANGKRTKTTTESTSGRRVGHRIPRNDEDVDTTNLDVGATIRAAAGRSAAREQPFSVQKEDLRTSVRKRKVGNLILFILDASASMGCHERIASTKQVVSHLLVDAYQKRDRVGLITFRDQGAQLVLAPTSSIQLAKIRIKDLSTGGATPLAHGLAMGLEVAKRELRRDSDMVPLLVLITDGYGNVAYASGNPLRESLEMAKKIREEGLSSVVFDTSRESAAARAGRPPLTQARRIADALGGDYHRLASFQPQEILARLDRNLG
jgi:magnesium chelatase subunit D